LNIIYKKKKEKTKKKKKKKKDAAAKTRVKTGKVFDVVLWNKGDNYTKNSCS
jgi:hypothetical protein